MTCMCVFADDQNNTCTAFNTPRYDGIGGTLVTVIMALFLLVANILLLNLLIAIFKYVIMLEELRHFVIC